MREITVTQALSTSLPVEKVLKAGDEAMIKARHTETRMAGRGKWINDFEVSGPPGKVDAFMAKLNDISHD